MSTQTLSLDARAQVPLLVLADSISLVTSCGPAVARERARSILATLKPEPSVAELRDAVGRLLRVPAGLALGIAGRTMAMLPTHRTTFSVREAAKAVAQQFGMPLARAQRAVVARLPV